GNQLIREYMLREYPAPKDFASFLYVSQVLQAEGIKVGAEHFRRTRPRNMGSLYWQIDDCWPVASWSSIDYFGRWKALQYYARRFYNDLLVSPHVEAGNMNFYIVSDRPTETPAQLAVSLLDFAGHTFLSMKTDVQVAALESKSYLSQPLALLLQGRDTKNLFLRCELLVGGQTVASNEYFFRPFKQLALPQPQLSTDVIPTPHGFRVTLTTDQFARAVYLSLARGDGFFSDNYFDLLPGQPRSIDFRPRGRLALNDFRQQLKVRSLMDAF